AKRLAFERRGGLVSLKIYDITGREIETLVNETLQPGSYEVTFDGSKLTSGVYFYKLVTVGYTETKKMVMIK
ncbi:MAG: T9SS type A sorting domain-containing protein, partial [Ignavibacteria bacterium]